MPIQELEDLLKEVNTTSTRKSRVDLGLDRPDDTDRIDESFIEQVIKSPGRAAEAFKKTRAAGLEKAENLEGGLGSRLLQSAGAGEEAFIEAPVAGLRELSKPIIDLFFDTVAAITPDKAKEIAGSTISQVVEDLSAVGDLVGGVVQVTKDKFDGLSPEAQKNILAAKEILSLPFELVDAASVGGAAGTTKKLVKKGVKEVIDLGTDVVKKTIKKGGLNAEEAAAKEIEKVTGKIVQGKTKDIPKAIKAFDEIDTTGIKTFQELEGTISKKVSSLSKNLDEVLDTKPDPILLDDLVTTAQVGETEVSQNFVSKALDQLEELYTKTDDLEELARIKNVKKQATSEGLSLKEINEVAKEYGRDFGKKAFSKLGEPLTSVNAQAFENTRKGVKETFRTRLDNPLAKELDLKQSNLINTNNNIAKMVEKVNSLEQKVNQRGVLEALARKTGRAVNQLSFGTIKGFLSANLPSNIGNKVLNSIDLQDQLAKNLKKLDKLTSLTNEEEIATGLIDLIGLDVLTKEFLSDDQVQSEKE